MTGANKSLMILGRLEDARPPVTCRDGALARLNEFFHAKGEHFGLTRLSLFGSFARNEAGSESDVDVAFASNQRLGLKELTALLRGLEECLGRGVDLCELSHVHPLIRDTMTEDLVDVASHPSRDSRQS
jgi:predicted nucleotidyltransferase